MKLGGAERDAAALGLHLDWTVCLTEPGVASAHLTSKPRPAPSIDPSSRSTVTGAKPIYATRPATRILVLVPSVRAAGAGR